MDVKTAEILGSIERRLADLEQRLDESISKWMIRTDIKLALHDREFKAVYEFLKRLARACEMASDQQKDIELEFERLRDAYYKIFPERRGQDQQVDQQVGKLFDPPAD